MNTKQNIRSLVLRDYQQETVTRLQNYEGRAGLCVLATGLGKTLIFTEFLRREVTESDHRCLILSHRAELVRQPLTYLADLPCGVELAAQRADLVRHKIISASVQSLVGRLRRYNPREIDTIIVDEAHHAAAPTYRKILEHFSSAKVIGTTATAHRGDRIGLNCVFEDLLCEYDTLWGIEHGYLTPIECHQVQLKYKMGSVRISEYGDFNQRDIDSAVSGTAAGVVEAYQSYARGQTIIFAASAAEACDITGLLNRHTGKKVAGLILGNTKNRDRILEAYKLGVLKVLVNFGVLTEGTDLPSTETVIIARPIAHTNVGLYAQMVGRALRLYPGKATAQVIDCVGISDYPICTAATLIGKPLPKEKPKALDPNEEKLPDENTVQILKKDEIPDTWIRKQKEVNIVEKGKGLDLHGVAWISLENGGYLLAIPNMVYRISRPDTNGNVWLRKNKKCSKSAVPSQMVFDYVFQDLQKNHPHDRHIWEKNRRHLWDSQPITPQQSQLIHKLAPDYPIDTNKMTRGDASQLIQLLAYTKEERKGEAICPAKHEAPPPVEPTM